jgi:signal transduction histidine kinase
MVFPAVTLGQIDSLKQLLDQCHDTARYRIATELADELYYAGNLHESIQFYQLAANEELQRKTPDLGKVTKALSNVGYCFYEKAQFQKASETYAQALEFASQTADSTLLSDIYVNLGNAWFYMGNYEKSVTYYSKALSVDEAMKNNTFVGINLSNLGKVFEAWKQSEKAIDFYSRALKISRNMNDSNSMAIRLSNIGTSYMSLNQYDSALFYMKQAYEIDSVRRNYGKLAGRLDLIGLIYQRQGKYLQADPYFSKALTFATHPKLVTSKAIILSNYAKNSMYRNDFVKAEDLAMESLELSVRLGLANTKLSNYLTLSDIFKKKRNYPQALLYLEKYANYRDTVFSEQSQKSLNEFQVLYETEKKDNEIRQLNQQQRIHEIELQSTRRQRWMYLILAFAMLSVASVLFILYRNKRQTGQLLQKKNDELKILNHTKDRFISILAHDLKNPLSAFTNITEALEQNYDDFEEANRKEIVSRLHQSAKSTYLLLKNLLEWATIQKQSALEKIEPVNVSIIAHEVIQILEPQAEQKQVQLINHIEQGLEVLADKSYLSVIFNNLVTNAIKFSHTGNAVRLESTIKNNFVEFSVSDQGIGMSADELEKLFRIDVDVRSIGSHQNKGTGLGLILCKEMVEKMGGKINVESKQGSGSKFMVILPVKTAENN